MAGSASRVEEKRFERDRKKKRSIICTMYSCICWTELKLALVTVIKEALFERPGLKFPHSDTGINERHTKNVLTYYCKTCLPCKQGRVYQTSGV